MRGRCLLFLTSLASLCNQSRNAFLALCPVAVSLMIYFMAMAYAGADLPGGFWIYL